MISRNPNLAAPFVYAVRTTGVSCRPGCASRRPLRSNVEFFDRWEDAKRHGYRACLKCRPDAPQLDQRHPAVARALRLIRERGAPMTLAPLARAVGLSPSYFHRLFTRELGMTPRAFALSLQPQIRSEARTSTVCVTIERCDLGWVAIAATPRGVTLVEFGSDRPKLRAKVGALLPRARWARDDPHFRRKVSSVMAMIERPSNRVGPALDLDGTEFRRTVWQALRAIPAGATRTYAELARIIGRPSAVRAVARACAANRVAVAVPCHRVIRSDGALGGYRWGLDRKRQLLDRESTPAAHARSIPSPTQRPILRPTQRPVSRTSHRLTVPSR